MLISLVVGFEKCCWFLRISYSSSFFLPVLLGFSSFLSCIESMEHVLWKEHLCTNITRVSLSIKLVFSTSKVGAEVGQRSRLNFNQCVNPAHVHTKPHAASHQTHPLMVSPVQAHSSQSKTRTSRKGRRMIQDTRQARSTEYETAIFAMA